MANSERNNMRCSYCLAIALVLLFAIGPCDAGETENLVLRLLEKAGTKADLSLIDDTNRQGMITLLRDIATRKVTQIGTTLPDSMAAQIVLLRLADPETIQRVVSDFRTMYGRRRSFELAEDLELAAHGAALPYLANDFSRQDGDKSTILKDGGARIRVIPQSAFSGVTTLRIIIASDQFPPEVRQWAKERLIQGAYPFDKLRDDVALWWEQNGKLVSNGLYGKTRPLQEAASVPAAAIPLRPSATPRPPLNSAISSVPHESAAKPAEQVTARPQTQSSRWFGPP